MTFKGETKNAPEWARSLGLSVSAFKRRLELWPLERAIEQSKGPTGPKSKKTEREEKERGKRLGSCGYLGNDINTLRAGVKCLRK